MVVVDVEDVVVVVVRQPPETQASQQLGTGALHALPPFGATQRSLRWTEHEVVPEFWVRQQATEPGLPHVDLEAQRLTTETQLLFTTVALACPAAQAT